jgi:hypothetical protein
MAARSDATPAAATVNLSAETTRSPVSTWDTASLGDSRVAFIWRVITSKWMNSGASANGRHGQPVVDRKTQTPANATLVRVDLLRFVAVSHERAAATCSWREVS